MEKYCKLHDIHSSLCPHCECDRLRGELEHVKKELVNANRGAERNFKALEIVAKNLSAERSRADKLQEELDNLSQELKWKTEHGIDGTGEAWLTHRMEQDAKILELTWDVEKERERADLNYRALELACSSLYQQVGNEFEVAPSPDYFIKKAQEEKK